MCVYVSVSVKCIYVDKCIVCECSVYVCVYIVCVTVHSVCVSVVFMFV